MAMPIAISWHAAALAARGTTLIIWQLPPGGTGWTKTQVISVPIQLGSSG